MQREIRTARQTHNRSYVERFRRAYAVHDLLAVHRLVLRVECDEIKSNRGTELDEIRRRKRDAYADRALACGNFRLGLVDTHLHSF